MKHINWDEYFMALAEISAMRSKDPNTQVGATLVNTNNRVIGLGYNGMPKGNDNFPWQREGKPIDTKYPYVIHAEMNALLNATVSVNGSRLYVSLFPCSNCSKLIAQSRIEEIIYSSDKYKGLEDNIIAKNIFKNSNIKTRQIKKMKITIHNEK